MLQSNPVYVAEYADQSGHVVWLAQVLEIEYVDGIVEPVNSDWD
jgi:hypothetical protein